MARRPTGGGYGGRGGGRAPHPDDGETGGERAGEREIFVDLVQRRLGGGAPPTPQAYARAMRQWQKLPGAVGFVPVDDLADDLAADPDADPATPDGTPDGTPGGGRR